MFMLNITRNFKDLTEAQSSPCVHRKQYPCSSASLNVKLREISYNRSDKLKKGETFS
jgi:hypothetical protein